MRDELRTMPWEERVWKAFLRAAAYIPPTVRMEAIIAVIEESEKNAQARGAREVGEQDLIAAARRRVPPAYRETSLKILEEQGIKPIRKVDKDPKPHPSTEPW